MWFNHINVKKVPRENAHSFENSLDFAVGVGPILSKLFTQIHSGAGFLRLRTLDIWGQIRLCCCGGVGGWGKGTVQSAWWEDSGFCHHREQLSREWRLMSAGLALCPVGRVG